MFESNPVPLTLISFIIVTFDFAAFAIRVIKTFSPLASFSPFIVILLLDILRVHPPGTLALINSNPSGKLSVAIILVAIPGPLLIISITYSTLSP